MSADRFPYTCACALTGPSASFHFGLDCWNAWPWPSTVACKTPCPRPADFPFERLLEFWEQLAHSCVERHGPEEQVFVMRWPHGRFRRLGSQQQRV